MSTWHDAGCVSDFPDGTGREVVVGDQIVALFRVGNEVFAMDGICSHQGGPLAEGTLRGPIVTCPWHGWQYNVRTGKQQISRSICQATFPVRVVGDRILVAVDE